ncbi:MAG: CRISPR-associated endoribonuclease Cas6 [Lentisphaeraceae bacterium]|nr:CRISPR-associated endoribonuclease Cas6 [Lentisphaeraceae bacterium]
MQYEIQLRCLDDKTLSFDYLYPLYSAIMRSLTLSHSSLAKEIHDGIHKNRVKLFCFSPLNGGKSVVVEGQKRKQLQIEGRTWFRISSPIPEFLNAISESLLSQGEINILGKSFRVTGINMTAPPKFKEEMAWRPFGSSASIVTAWSPRDGKKRFLRPGHNEEGYPDVEKILADNLTLKFNKRLFEIRDDVAKAWLRDSELDAVIQGETPIAIELLPYSKDKPYKKVTVQTKNINIYSWRAPVKVKAPIAMQRMIWSSGLGSLNSQGFGLMQEGKDDN